MASTALRVVVCASDALSGRDRVATVCLPTPRNRQEIVGLTGSRRAGPDLPRLRKQFDDFLVGGLAEVGIVKANGVERLRCRQKNHLIALGLKFTANGERRHGRRKNEVTRLISPDPLQGRLHGRAGRYSIVDDDRQALFDVDRLNRAKIEAPTTLDLGE